MKKILSFISAVFISWQLFAGTGFSNPIVLSDTQIAKINDERKSIIHISLSEMEAQDSILVKAGNFKDTIVAKNGMLEFQYGGNTIETINFYKLPKYLGNGKYTPFYMQPLTVIAFPNSELFVTGTFEAYKVSGNEFYKEYNKMNAPIEANYTKLKEISDKIHELSKNNQITDSILNQFKKEFKLTQENNELLVIDYVSKHLDSSLSAYLLYYHRPSAGEKYIHKISAAVQNGEMKDFYQKAKIYYENIAAKRAAAEKIQPGKIAPDFTLKDIEGKNFRLSSLKGKYVVLDFWGSWCGWCIKGMPDMKKMYTKYKNKLEIVGIDCNDPEAKWKNAVAKHQLPWIHVINNPRGGTNTVNMYNISGFPTKIIISPEGNIVKVIVGEDPAFYTTIDDLMK